MLRWICLVAVGLVTGCAARNSTLPQDTHATNEPTVVVVWVDGFAQPTLHRGLRDGTFPHLARHFVEQGRIFDQVCVTIPSLTYINAAGLLTGMRPESHGIYGNRWFDRSTGQLRNYGSLVGFDKINVDLAVPTVHELIQRRKTMSVQCHTQRGADYLRNNLITSGLAWVGRDFVTVERNVANEATWLAALPPDAWPGFALFYFPTADELAHEFGLGPRYLAALQRIDQRVGEMIDTLRAANTVDRPLYFALITDHGQVQVPAARRHDLFEWIQSNRLPDLARGDEMLWRSRSGLLLVGAPRRAVLHLRGDGWSQPISEELTWDVIEGSGDAAPLWAAPGVGLLAARRGDRIELVSNEGRCQIRRDGDRMRLDPIEGRLAATLAGTLPLRTLHSDRQWLAATAGGSWPDLVPHIAWYFDSTRAGDVLFLAAPDAGFEADAPAGHGGGQSDEVRVSFLWQGPGVAIGRDTTPLRTIDLVPTVLELLGEERPAGLDGRSFRRRLTGQTDAELIERAR